MPTSRRFFARVHGVILTAAVMAFPWINFAATTSGRITGPEVWSGTIQLTGDITIADTGRLTIQPGTRIRSALRRDATVGGADTGRIEIIVEGGNLIADGTAANPIVFTSAGTDPQPGDWYGIRIGFGGIVTLRHCVVEYGRHGLHIAGGGGFTFENSTFQRNELSGIRVNFAGSFAFAGCRALENGGHGFFAGPNATTNQLSSCKFADNDRHGVLVQHNQSTTTLIQGEISNNGTDGVNSSGEVHLVGSIVTQNKDDGVKANVAIIKRSTFRDNQRIGVYAEKVMIEDSTLELNKEAGIRGGGSYNSDHVTVIGSRIARNGDGIHAGNVSVLQTHINNNGKDGVYARVSVSVVESRVNSNVGAGIVVGSRLKEGGIQGNEIQFNRVGIVFNSGQPRLDISGNDITANLTELENKGTAAIVANGNYWGEPTTSELQQGRVNLSKIIDSQKNPSVGPINITDWALVPLVKPPDTAPPDTKPPQSEPYHPADNHPADWRISISEVTAYGAAWKIGATWPIEPSPIPIGYLTRAGVLWKVSEAYTLDGSVPQPPLWWVSADSSSAASIGLHNLHQIVLGTIDGVVTRSISGATVTLLVQPAASVQVYAVEETVPEGFTALLITGGASFDANNRKVKWGPFFDNGTRELTYELGVPSGFTGTVTLEGLGSFNGVDAAIAGENQFVVAAPSPVGDPGSGPVTRAVLQSDTELQVTLDVKPNSTTRVYAVEETLPEGFVPSSISDGGSHNAKDRKIKWGPFFDNSPRTFSYTLTPPPGFSGAVNFNGLASFDGLDSVSGGTLQIKLPPDSGGQLPAPPNLEAGVFAGVWIRGTIGATYILEVSNSLDSASWTELDTVELKANPQVWVDVESPNYPKRFYRARVR